MSYRLGTTASRIVWLIFLLVPGFLLVVLSVGASRAMHSKHWPTTEGVVIAYQEDPNYRYSVAGHAYVGSQVSCNRFVSSTADRKNTERNVARYYLGARVTVYYDPNKPSVAALETDFDSSIFIAIAALLLFCVFGGFGFIRGWRWRLGRGLSGRFPAV